MTSISFKLEPAIWSRDTGQRITCFDRCQLIIAPEKYTVNQGCMSVNLFLEYGRHVARLRRRRRRRRRAYAPTSNTASHDNHEKILHGLPFLSRDDYGAPLGGPSGHRSSAKNRAVSVSKIQSYF